jgi:prepilin-type N-terminal cleavage/methylation domain-containing protein
MTTTTTTHATDTQDFSPAPAGGRRSRRRAAGFTLVEVMITVAMVLLLLYGVTQVFKMSGDAMGANQAVSTILRDHRAAFATMDSDFRNAAPDSPLFMISSTVAYTKFITPTDITGGTSRVRGVAALYRDAGDEMQNPLTLSGASLVLGTDKANPNIHAGARNPRIDRMGFFARGFYRRQIARWVPGTTSNEAWVWYGHVAGDSTGRTGAYTTYAGGATMILPENQFGADRILGRVAILMRHRPASPPAADPWVGAVGNVDPPNTAGAFWPLEYGTKSYQFNDTYGDLAPNSIDDLKARVNEVYAAQMGATNVPLATDSWWFRAMEDSAANNRFMRYMCDTRVQRPMTLAGIAKTMPFFVGRCTQFIVEYAGDFVTQDENGDVTNAESTGVAEVLVKNASGAAVTPKRYTDGVVDYVVDKNGSGANKDWVRRVRWYGFPRDVDGDGKILMNDVVPLADVLTSYKAKFDPGATEVRAPWEADLPYNPNRSAGSSFDYATVTAGQLTASPSTPLKYTCAWHNDAPPMIRVLVKIDDATGRLQDGQWYEYVFTR